MTAGHSDRGHAPLSPSGFDRWANCPGSVAACESAPRENSRASIDGTRGHELTEACWLTRDEPAAYIGKTMPSGIVTEEDAQAAAVVLAEYSRVEAEGCRLAIEERVEDTGIHPDCWGTPDALGVIPDSCVVVIDAKFGRKPIDATTTQLVIYGIKRALDLNLPLRCIIVQPHTSNPVRRHLWMPSTLRTMLEGLQAAATAAMAPDAPRNAGPWCEYCPARHACDVFQTRALAVAQVDFPAGPGARTIPPSPSDLTPQQVAEVLRLGDTIEAWIASVRARAQRLAEQGTPPPGFKLVQGRPGLRKWKDDTTTAAALRALGVEPFDQVLLSPAKVEKLLGKEHRQALADLCVRSEGKPELAPLSDKRPAISGPAEDFST